MTARRSRTLVAGALVALATCAPALRAQVGNLPENSPFRDVEKRQDVSLIVGQSLGGKDKVGAAPRGGMVYGLRYDVNLGASPLAFTSTVLRQSAGRDILQPGLPAAQRIGGHVSQPLWMWDAAFTLLLTGNRSWRSLIPSVTAGVGLVTDNREVSDSSQFRFGTRFSPVLGFGVKYAPLTSRWTLRADLSNHFYSVPYPQTFRDSTVGVPRITTAKSSWTRNTLLTLGLTRQIGRR
ncbi:MAG: hypothetical protein IT355_00495 [Gemmatimonadaceae bacterium]|nr:hypothetical protein [Gemmatimonadaceae bacterium]